MKNGKYSARRSGSKVLVLALAMVLLVTATVGGTLAWLTDKTDEVKNTFTTAGIEIDLFETKNPDGTVPQDGKVTNWSAALIPGFTYHKNPKVTVDANSVDCYLFVKFEETNNPSNYLSYTSTLSTANGWTKGQGEGDGKDGIPTNVWYRKVMANDANRSWYLLEGEHDKACKKDDSCTCTYGQGKVSVKSEKFTMPDANSAPALIYTAYATQLYKSAGVEFSAKEAWAIFAEDTSK